MGSSGKAEGLKVEITALKEGPDGLAVAVGTGRLAGCAAGDKWVKSSFRGRAAGCLKGGDYGKKEDPDGQAVAVGTAGFAGWIGMGGKGV